MSILEDLISRGTSSRLIFWVFVTQATTTILITTTIVQLYLPLCVHLKTTLYYT